MGCARRDGRGRGGRVDGPGSGGVTLVHSFIGTWVMYFTPFPEQGQR